MPDQNKLNLIFRCNGELTSLSCGATELALPDRPCELFAFQLRDFIGNPMLFEVGDFGDIQCRQQGNVTILDFCDCNRLPGTRVTATAESADDGIHWRICVKPGTADFAVEWIDYPRLVLKNFADAQYLLPYAEGTLVANLAQREEKSSFPCRMTDYPLTGINSYYPGPAAMQFEAMYTMDAGLCVVCRDPKHYPKTIDVLPYGGGVRLLLQHFTGGKEELPYEVVSTGFQGNWQDAAEIYRVWMEGNDPCLPAKLDARMPQWLADSPVLIAYPVKGTGVDSGGLTPNEYYPYRAALPVMEKYHQLWQNPVMALLMHWEGTAPWAPPYVWPPSGGEDLLAEYIDAMHRVGNTVGLYGSGIAWTQKSMIDPNYSLSKRFADERVDQEICTGPRGETFSRVCNNPKGQRLGYDLCAARKFTADTVVNEVAAAAKLGVDYLQYFDQNQGCSAPFCYSKHHGHPALPGAWLTEAMQNLLARAQAAAGRTVLGCENAAAEPYLEVCQLNDLRNHLAWGSGGMPVPLYPYLFHEYSAGFSGNGVCLSEWVDVERTPFFLQWALAWNFISGNLLSVVLKDGGKIHWHWNLLWSVSEPAQQPLLTLIGNLSRWRRGRAAQYLVAGRMQKTPPVSCGVRTIFLKQQTPAKVPAIEASAWEKDNKHAVILTNYGEKSEPCRIDLAALCKGSLYSRQKETAFEADSLLVEVPPLDAVLIEY